MKFTNRYNFYRFKIFLFIVYMIQLYFSGLFSQNILANEAIRINTREQPPYQIVKGTLITGVAVETVKCAFKKLKVNTDIRLLAWERAQLEVKNGEADAFFSAIISSERNLYAVPSNNILEYNWVWVLNKNTKLDPNSEDFRIHRRVGTMFASMSLAYLKRKKYNIVGTPVRRDQGINMLTSNRFDAFLMPNISLDNAFKDAKKSKRDYKVIFHSHQNLVIYFGKKYLKLKPNMLSLFNSKIPECRESAAKSNP